LTLIDTVAGLVSTLPNTERGKARVVKFFNHEMRDNTEREFSINYSSRKGYPTGNVEGKIEEDKTGKKRKK
jgi:hypothetical protein